MGCLSRVKENLKVCHMLKYLKFKPLPHHNMSAMADLRGGASWKIYSRELVFKRLRPRENVHEDGRFSRLYLERVFSYGNLCRVKSLEDQRRLFRKFSWEILARMKVYLCYY